MGVVPGRLILEGWVPETGGPKMPDSSQVAGIRPASASSREVGSLPCVCVCGGRLVGRPSTSHSDHPTRSQEV